MEQANERNIYLWKISNKRVLKEFMLISLYTDIIVKEKKTIYQNIVFVKEEERKRNPNKVTSKHL